MAGHVKTPVKTTKTGPQILPQGRPEGLRYQSPVAQRF
jgi:hypothetical protein